MTDATTGAGAEDTAKRRSVTPIPPETTGTTQTPEAAEREPVRGAGDLAGGGAAGLSEDRTTGRVMGQEKGQETDREGVASDLHSTSDKGRPSISGTAHRTGTTSTTPAATTTRLLPHEECDKLELRLRQAVSGFVDGPRGAVEEADHVVEEIAGRFTEALTRRRRTLRMSWQDGERGEKSGSPATHPDTEQLRLALRDYRELAERLLQS